MLEAVAILERIDRIMRELEAIRVAVATAANSADEVDDFAPEHLIESSTAVGRFKVLVPAGGVWREGRRQMDGLARAEAARVIGFFGFE
jgi:hypothetical protein